MYVGRVGPLLTSVPPGGGRGGGGVTVSLEAAMRAPAPSASGPITAALSGHVLAGSRNKAPPVRRCERRCSLTPV